MACYEILEVDVELRNADKATLKKALEQMKDVQLTKNYDETYSVFGELKGRYFNGNVNIETGQVTGTRGMTQDFVALLKQQYAREAINGLAKYGWEIEQTGDGVTLTQGGQQW